MGKTLACKDMGIDCPFVARAETEEELMPIVSKHGKEVHGYTDEQLMSPEMMGKVKTAVKDE